MRIGSVQSHHALRQHGALAELLQVLGARVESLPFVHGAFDSVFVKDNAILVEDGDGAGRALLARPRHAERVVEQPARHRALGDQGFRVDVPLSASFEGGDLVTLPFEGGALLGTGFRSLATAAPSVSAFLQAPVYVLELADSHLYHLDTALTALGDGTVAYCPEAFRPSSIRWIEKNFSPDRLLRVPYRDACGFALNTIEVGKHCILGGPSAWLEPRLRERGWSVHVPDLTQFRRAGGSAACLVARVHSRPSQGRLANRLAVRSTAA